MSEKSTGQIAQIALHCPVWGTAGGL